MLTNDPIIARRAGRIAFGSVLVLGMVALVIFSIVSQDRRLPVHAWQILVGTWVAAFAIAGVVRRVTGWREPSAVTELDEDRQRVRAFAMPAVGIALLAPLTLHFLVVLVGVKAAPRALSGFDNWTAAALVFTGVAHVTFAWLVYVRAVALARGTLPVTIWRIFRWTLIASCIPGFVVLAPLGVAVTGLPIWPLLRWMPELARRDRELGLPKARVWLD